MNDETKNPFPKEWQLWKIVVPNEHATDPENPKKRPVILVETWVDEGEDDENLDEYFPSFAVGTTKVKKYMFEPDTVIFSTPERLERYRLHSPTIFRFSKSEGEFTEELSMKDFIENGEYVADITPEDKAYIIRQTNGRVGEHTKLHACLKVSESVGKSDVAFLRDWLQLGKERHMKGFDPEAGSAYIVFPKYVKLADQVPEDGTIYKWLDDHGFDWKVSVGDYTYKTVGSFNSRTMRTTGAGYDRTLKDRVRLDISWDPSDKDERIDESMEVHDELNQKLFDGDELRDDVSDAIGRVVDVFVSEMEDDGVAMKVNDVLIIGSNVNYNYGPDSDLDVHIIADGSALDCSENIRDLLYSAYRSIFDKNYDITIKGIPLEIFVEIDELHGSSNGVYSLFDGWVKKPVRSEIPEVDEFAVADEVAEWRKRAAGIFTSEEAEQFLSDVYGRRQDSLTSEGEYGIGNLVFKSLRNDGTLRHVKKLRKELVGKELSLEGLSQLDEEMEFIVPQTLEQIKGVEIKEGDGTYVPNNDGTWRKVNIGHGYQASFFRPNITNQDIVDIRKAIGEKLGQEYLGVFGGDREISYTFGEKEDALEFARIFNQEAIWDNGSDAGIKNPSHRENQELDYSQAKKELQKFLDNKSRKA